MNDPGVCLDALAFALANVGDSALVAILLENEDEVSPPLLVSHAPRIDFSCWQTRQSEGRESFERWYATAFTQLVDALESHENPEGEIEELRCLLGISSTHQAWVKKAAGCLEHGFVEPEWMESSITTWLQDDISGEASGSNTSYVFSGSRADKNVLNVVLSDDMISGRGEDARHKISYITGAPDGDWGVLASHLSLWPKFHVVGLHFCEKTDSVRDVLLSLAFQASTRLPEYRRFLLASLRKLTPDALASASEEELFDVLLHRAASVTVDGGRSRYAFVLDDLESGNASLSNLVMQKAMALPGWLRFIVTRNSDDPADCIRLADTLSAAENHGTAIALYQRALSLWKKTQNIRDPRFLPTCVKLADSKFASGDHAGALHLYKLNLAIEEEELSPDDPAIARACIKVADALQTLDNPAEAHPLYERALSILKKAATPDSYDPRITTTTSKLADTLYTLGKHAESRPLYEYVLSILEAKLDPYDPYIAMTCSNLAFALYQLGHYAEARSLYERLLGIWEKTRGIDHPATQAVRDRLRNLKIEEASSK